MIHSIWIMRYIDSSGKLGGSANSPRFAMMLCMLHIAVGIGYDGVIDGEER